MTNNDDGEQRRQQTTMTTNNDVDDVNDKETWGGSNTTISISHGEQHLRTETAMSNKTNVDRERRHQTTNADDEQL